MAERAEIKVRGIVQGVGFRPFVYNLAVSFNLNGFVINTAEGVTIEVEGSEVSRFIAKLGTDAPSLSKITDISISILPEHGYKKFEILESAKSLDTEKFTMVSPDVTVCDDCLKEMFDPKDRRYLYPFINCTNCGPRFSITKAVPYDRPDTTMAVFKMCRECLAEYKDPKNRRFHAQPNACPKCGPSLELKILNQDFKNVKGKNPLEHAITLLKHGAVIAIKGIGGFHIACDAENDEAVKKLRERKRRNNKPFALMASEIRSIKLFANVSKEEEDMLLSNRRPIVLLRKQDNPENKFSDFIAPNNKYLGFMLPYTPLHYLLLKNEQNENLFNALVMTSGNFSEEPIVRDNNEAIEKLSALADAVLLHNRDIFMRVDDSVLSTHDIEEKSLPVFIRRSRGYVPEPIPLQGDGPEVIGCGADMKNTFTLTKGSFAISSQHIGDMENYETLKFFEESFENIKSVYKINPTAIGHDIHPGYMSTQWALKQDLEKYPIQHHYAHIASVMAEHGINKKVIGAAFDGTGLGTDGKIWGSEFLLADINGFERLGHFKYIPLPGAETAIREPWRTAVSYICESMGEEAMEYLDKIGFIKKYKKENIDAIIKVMNSREFSPLSSGAGRLFDAVSAITGICDKNTFEGEAAIALEAVINDAKYSKDYPVNIKKSATIVIDFSQTILEILRDVIRGEDKKIISIRFHNTIVNVIIKTVKILSERLNIYDVVLSGGTFQNRYITERTVSGLLSNNIKVFLNKAMPCNDACVSLGQAYIVRERIKNEKG
ncbi:MAG: carbamoyltransferase HypF [Nitrospiraceae bacterium]|nr:carbamoyltransferase HypF [Nitrospiraceae bacterium]